MVKEVAIVRFFCILNDPKLILETNVEEVFAHKSRFSVFDFSLRRRLVDFGRTSTSVRLQLDWLHGKESLLRIAFLVSSESGLLLTYKTYLLVALNIQ